MEKHKTQDTVKRLAKVLLSPGDLGRPIMSSPGTPADRVNTLREAFTKTMNDPALIADAKKRKWDLDPLNGDALEATAKEVVAQPREVVEKMKALLAN
jgi:tripartite-type tricarboxylate transporter receptor subunit TctC